MKILKTATQEIVKNSNHTSIAMIYAEGYSDSGLNKILGDNGIKSYVVKFKDDIHVIVKYELELIDSTNLDGGGVRNTWKNQLGGRLYTTVQYV